MSQTKKEKREKSEKSLELNILKIFSENPYGGFNFKQVSKLLNIENNALRNQVKAVLKSLANERILNEVKTGKYKLNPKYVTRQQGKSADTSSNRTGNRDEARSFRTTGKASGNYVTGRVDMKRTGKAYVIPDDKTEDIKIAPNNTGKALHGDMVKVALFPKRKDKKIEGEIIEVISRARTNFVGVISISRNFAFLIPDNPTVQVDLYIPLNSLNGAKNGDKAIAEMTDWPEGSKNPFGKIVNVLGTPGDNNVEMQSILAEFDFPLKFPDAVEAEAHRIKDKVSKSEFKNRRDFRDVTTFTIDPVDAKDFDDALSLKKLDNGNYEVGVHIADVSHYVREDTLLENEAYKRGTSVYLVDRVIPMLPEKLSNGVCSLKPNEDKFCFSAVFELNDDAEVLDEWFGKTVIHSNRRFNYDEVQVILDNNKGDFAKDLTILNSLAKKLREERYSKGSINFFTEEVKFRLDEKGKPLEVYIKEQKDSHKLIEDFMLLANRKVAELIGKKKGNAQIKTFVYRIHDKPAYEKLEDFKRFVNNLGYKVRIDSAKAIADSFNALFQEILDKPEENIITQLAIRTMAKAYYSTKNIGHYGLSFSYYTHFTSPIRRYPDLMVHRLLERYIINKENTVQQPEYEKKCRHSSEMEKKAVDAERASVKYKQVEFMKDRIGEIFDGIITGVSKWGLYIEISDNKCEGMVRIQDIADDFYYLDEDNFRYIGQRKGKIYRLGDNVVIKVKNADLSKKHLDFMFC